MSEFKEYILESLKDLHIKLHYGNNYDLNTYEGLMDRVKDLSKEEQLKEVVRNNPEWDIEEISKELSQRIKRKMTMWK